MARNTCPTLAPETLGTLSMAWSPLFRGLEDDDVPSLEFLFQGDSLAKRKEVDMIEFAGLVVDLWMKGEHVER
jgi:hypothetical protein